MALIHCSKCGKKINDQVLTCPNCGHQINLKNGQKKCPIFLSNLNIGDPVSSLGGNAMLSGKYYSTSNEDGIFPDGDISIIIHKRGLHIFCTKKFKVAASLDIHNSQIDSIKEVSDMNLLNKAIIKNSVSGILLGPLYAVIKGMTGKGKQIIVNDKCFLIINCWNVEDKQLYSISFECYSYKSCISFIRRYERESEIF